MNLGSVSFEDLDEHFDRGAIRVDQTTKKGSPIRRGPVEIDAGGGWCGIFEGMELSIDPRGPRGKDRHWVAGQWLLEGENDGVKGSIKPVARREHASKKGLLSDWADIQKIPDSRRTVPERAQGVEESV
jgi:hypothetical protein